MTIAMPATFILFLSASAPPQAAPPSPDPELVVAPGARIRVALPAGAARLEAALDGGLLLPLEAELAAPTEGEHWLVSAARDAAGNRSPLRWTRIHVDGQPPQLRLSFEPELVEVEGVAWLPPGTLVAIEAEDSAAGVAQVSLAVGSRTQQASAARLETRLETAGPHRIEGQGRDRVGNVADSLVREVRVDDRPPEGEIRVGGPAVAGADALVVGPGARAQAILDDAGSGLEGWTPLLDGKEVSQAAWSGGWAAGVQTLEVTAVDRVGNQATLAARRLNVDLEPPRLNWRLSAAASAETARGTVHRPPVRLEIESHDTPAGVERAEWLAPGGGWSPLEAALETHADSVRLRLSDRVGNVGEHELRWELDVEPPRLVVHSPRGEPLPPDEPVELRDGEALRLEASDEGAGVAHVEYRLDAELWRPAPELLRFVGAGEHLLELSAEDRLGQSARASWPVRVTPQETHP